MDVINPVFGVSPINTRMTCGCVCTQDVTNPIPKFDVYRDGQNSGGCAASCSSRDFNSQINSANADNQSSIT